MLRWLLKHSKIRILLGYIVYKYWQNTFLTTKLQKIGPYFCILFWRGGGGGKKMVERKCKSENA